MRRSLTILHVMGLIWIIVRMYPNYVDARLPTPEWHWLYYGTKYVPFPCGGASAGLTVSSFDRLQHIKTELDPNNVFRWPQSM